MKFKNYKSAIHNFAHSFQSIDILKSGVFAIDILIHLKHNHNISSATFDFVSKTIHPDEANTTDSRQLLKDYLEWLPNHFLRHNCDIDKLEKLTIEISCDFDKAFTPPKMSNARQISIKSKTAWKADGRPEEVIDISQDEVLDKMFLDTRRQYKNAL
jgi:hypothetical protein